MRLIVQLLNMAVAVDNALLHVCRDVEEVAHLLQQLQLKAELVAHNLQHWSASLTGIALVGKAQIGQEPSSKFCMGKKGRTFDSCIAKDLSCS